MDFKRLQLNEMNNKPKFIWAGQKNLINALFIS